MYQAFGHFSLAGGFSAPKLAAVMRETNYLTSDSRDATHKRLLETSLFVLDAMADMTTGESRGWRSAFRVRMLHAQVRIRIREGKARHNVYDEEENGVPINQAYVPNSSSRHARQPGLTLHFTQRPLGGSRRFHDLASLVPTPYWHKHDETRGGGVSSVLAAYRVGQA